MRRLQRLAILLSGLVCVAPGVLGQPAEQSSQKNVVLEINQDYEKKTVVKQSGIPNAGNGLFALVRIKKGEVIGELGGHLVGDDYADNGYLAELPECARKQTHPFTRIDAKTHGGNVSRINFAPSKINGRKTNFQNSEIDERCNPPFIVFVALRDIRPGEEIWSGYGPGYDYEKFMRTPEVRDFFCRLKKIDCSKKYTYAH